MANKAHKNTVRSKPKRIKKHEHHHYWPFIPVLLIVAIFCVTLLQPITNIGVLSYASQMSRDALLNSTNKHRVAKGVGSLAINEKLNQAAQAKANDMVARNYWAHKTPDGQEPWIFFEQAGYKYTKAGENLAYGFSNSDATVTGWMNSPSHKDNMLDSAFIEVGFGFANSENFNGSGPQTIIVAEYGRPYFVEDTNEQQPNKTEIENSQSSEQISTPSKDSQETISKSDNNKITNNQPVNSDQDTIIEPDSVAVARVSTTTGNTNPAIVFILGLLTGGLVVFLLAKHTIRIKHLIKDGEKFVLHHPILDSVVLTLILIGTILMQSTGFIR